MATISRQDYINLFGPTVGDKIRLGDTDLYIEIERDMRFIFLQNDVIMNKNKLLKAKGILREKIKIQAYRGFFGHLKEIKAT